MVTSMLSFELAAPAWNKDEDDGDGNFEREPVPEDCLKPNWTYASVFGGRHTAATEMVIGPQFVLGGASLSSMLYGLFLGNLACVLCWRYVVGRLAVKTRYSVYYQVEMIAGKELLFVYTLITGLVLATIAGAMFNIAGVAVASGFNVSLVDDAQFIPTESATMTIVMLVTGVCTTLIAAFGYNIVTLVSYWLTPPMFAVIGYMVYASCVELGINPGNMYEKLGEIYDGVQTDPEQDKMDFAAVLLIGWFCDQLLHIGCNDMTILRFAKDGGCGWYAALGMFPGHYALWIGAGVIFFVNYDMTGSTDPQPGPVAFYLAGWFGLGAVLFAGWSTANPTLYAAGLAFKSSIEAVGITGMSAKRVTLLTGAISTFASLFPPLIDQVLLLLGLGGALIMPMGAVIMADIEILPRLGRQSARPVENPTCNPAACAAYFPTIILAFVLIQFDFLKYWFVPFINYPLAMLLYVGVTMALPPRTYGDVELEAKLAAPKTREDMS